MPSPKRVLTPDSRDYLPGSGKAHWLLLAIFSGLVFANVSCKKEPVPEAAVYIYSFKPLDLSVTLDGKKISTYHFSSYFGIPLNPEGPNLLEVSEAGTPIVRENISAQSYAVNCSTTRTISCKELIFGSILDGPRYRLPNYLFRGQGQGIYAVKVPDGHRILGFSDIAPDSIDIHGPRSGDVYAWWLHPEPIAK